MQIRNFDTDRDLRSVARIWREIDWLPANAKDSRMLDYLADSRALVADLNGSAEAMTIAAPGLFRYLNVDLPIAAITGVVVGVVARKQGLALRLTAKLLVEEASSGAAVSLLSFFEQGFYDQLGFGNGPPENFIQFDPAQLRVKLRPVPAQRITAEDWRVVHGAMSARERGHGGCVLFPERWTRGEMRSAENALGLGYRDGPKGKLTHFFFGFTKGEAGPYTIQSCAWQTPAQLLELLALLASLDDQVRSIRIIEPQGLVLQDFLETPIRHKMITKNSPFPCLSEAFCCWQARILNLQSCLNETRLPIPEMRFNLELHDPITALLPEDSPWRGCQGDYVVNLGSQSRALPGRESGLPTLKASVGSFTRLWMGAKNAHMLALQPGFSAPEALLADLTGAFASVPPPSMGWNF